jgi:hypothetical protein
LSDQWCHTEARGAANFVNHAGRTEQRFGRDAASIQAIAPQQAALDQRNAGTKAGCADRADQTSRAAANDDEIVDAVWLRSDPALWVNRVGESPIGDVEWLNQSVLFSGPLGRSRVGRGEMLNQISFHS